MTIAKMMIRYPTGKYLPMTYQLDEMIGPSQPAVSSCLEPPPAPAQRGENLVQVGGRLVCPLSSRSVATARSDGRNRSELRPVL